MKWNELYINDVPDPHVKAVLNLMYTGIRYEKKMEQLLKPFGVSHQQFDILQILTHSTNEFLSLKEIQMSLINQTSNTTRLVEKLRLKDLITTKTNGTNRSKLDIAISNKGKQLLIEIHVPLNGVKKKLQAALTETDANELSRILPNIVTMLDE